MQVLKSVLSTRYQYLHNIAGFTCRRDQIRAVADDDGTVCSLPDGEVVAAVADVDKVACTEDLAEYGCLCSVTEVARAIGSVVSREEIEVGANTLCHLHIGGGDEIGGVALLFVFLDQLQHGMVVG